MMPNRLVWGDSGLEEIASNTDRRESDQYHVPILDYTGGYADDPIPHTTINERGAGFYGAFVIGSDYFILNEATADRPDTRDSTKRHEIAHYHFPNWHMNRAEYESSTLVMSGTVHSEQPRGSATFQMQDLDIARAYANQVSYR